MELNISQIMEIIPHRYPFLLVDKITDLVPGVRATGIKCVSANEMHFLGHFPNHPVMPGVLIVEALAQVACVTMLSLPENQGKLGLFRGINDCKFKRQVVPGDLLELQVEIIKTAANYGKAKTKALVSGKIVAYAEISFAF